MCPDLVVECTADTNIDAGHYRLFVSSVGVVAMWVGGCRRGLSTFPSGCRLLSSSLVAASVGGGASCSGSRVVRGRRLECGDREGGGGVCRECAALAAGVGARRCFGPAATGSHRSWTTPRSRWSGPRWSKAPRLMVSRPTCGPLERVGAVVTRTTGVVLSRASVWRLLTGRLGWSLQRPERRAVERDESEIARWIAHGWPRIKKRPASRPRCGRRRGWNRRSRAATAPPPVPTSLSISIQNPTAQRTLFHAAVNSSSPTSRTFSKPSLNASAASLARSAIPSTTSTTSSAAL